LAEKSERFLTRGKGELFMPFLFLSPSTQAGNPYVTEGNERLWMNRIADRMEPYLRPAINVGISVSRVGGAAQTKAMKKAAGTIRIDLAQYREMEVFTQFSSDLDDTTKEQLQYGKGLMELLKQPLCNPMSLAEQVITLVAATNRIFLDVDVKKTKEVQLGMLDFFKAEHEDIVDEINEKKVLDDALTERIVEAAKEYKSRI
jgi:F-type H+-transporting ATPase subunit alpha